MKESSQETNGLSLKLNGGALELIKLSQFEREYARIVVLSFNSNSYSGNKMDWQHIKAIQRLGSAYTYGALYQRV